jgi:tetratricopeptide (TPR) repeat protein
VVSVIIALSLLLFAGAAQTFDSVYRAGLIALQQNRPAEAEANLEAAAKLSPADGRVWVALADAYFKLNKTNAAGQAAAKAEALAPDDALVAHSLALFYAQAGSPLKAAGFELKYARANPSDEAARQRAAEWYFAASEPLLKKQKLAEAAAILEPAHAALPNDAQIQLAFGVACYGLRRFDEAAEQFLKTIDLAPEVRQPYIFLGKMMDQAPGKLGDAAPRFAAYRKAHPDDPLGYLLEAKALNAQNQNPDASRQLLLKATELAPADAASHLELGLVDERTQRLAEAAVEFERASALDPADPVAHYHLARVYDRLGQHERARAERDAHSKLVAAQDAIR